MNIAEIIEKIKQKKPVLLLLINFVCSSIAPDFIDDIIEKLTERSPH